MAYEEERNVLKEFKLKIFKEVEPENVVYLLRAQEVITEGECETIRKLVNICEYIMSCRLKWNSGLSGILGWDSSKA